MPDISMASARLAPAAWIAEIDRITAATSSLNSEIRRQWGLLKAATAYDGAWHSDVQLKVAMPYNLLHGSWAVNTTVQGKLYKSLPAARVRGLPNWVTGPIMPRGYATMYSNFGKTSKSNFKGIWLGTYVGRGTNLFKNTAKTASVTLQHNNIQAAGSDRVWYTNLHPQTIYTVTDHVDDTKKGQKALAELTADVTAWLDAVDIPITAGFLDLDWLPMQLYVIT